MKFLRDLTLGRYLPGTSSVHQLDPRAKLLACMLAVITVFLPSRTWGLVCAWPLLAVGVAASRIPLGYFLRGIKPFAWLFGFPLILHGLTTPGQILVRLPFLAVALTLEGLTWGAWVSAQLATAIAFSSLLTLTTNPVELVRALEHYDRQSATGAGLLAEASRAHYRDRVRVRRSRRAIADRAPALRRRARAG